MICGTNERAGNPSFTRSQGEFAAARGHYHGWQRAVGEAAAFAARGGASGGGGIGAGDYPHGGRVGDQISDALRFLGGELEPPQGRGGCVDEISGPLSQERNSGAEQEQCAPGGHWTDLSVAGKCAGAFE